jgi:DNA-binding LytR/AlgR family response regulator
MSPRRRQHPPRSASHEGGAPPAPGPRATALIADDEPLLRERLATHLARAWPQLQIVAQARNGREAVEAWDDFQPDIAFLDVHMPGMSGIDAARAIGRRALIVFITAYEQYAVQAFEQGAIDYLVKPFDERRLADTVTRLQQRLQRAPASSAGADAPPIDDLLDRLAQALQVAPPARAWLQWIKASVGSTVRLIPVEQVIYLRSDEKYTLVVWEGGEALIRRTIRELADELDPQRFVQIHRSVIVNLHQVAQVTRGLNETAEVQLKGRGEVLPVSRSYLHVFRQM